MERFILIFIFTLFLILSHQLRAISSQEPDKSTDWKPKEGLELIGTKAPPLTGLKWLNSKPLTLEDLSGKVVLIRFWLVGCPLCTRTAPSLVELNEKYSQKGLVVIGIHHPKSERTRNSDLVLRQAQLFGFNFPIAQDNDWKVIKSYWLNGKNRSYTSVSFLLDKNGRIRLINDGGEFYRSDENPEANAAFLAIDKKIQELLDENP
ncbi:MAG: redoxin domain-containing protein [Thermodesulfobacteriota bacterium]